MVVVGEAAPLGAYVDDAVVEDEAARVADDIAGGVLLVEVWAGVEVRLVVASLGLMNAC